jgi:hypothetical protein
VIASAALAEEAVGADTGGSLEGVASACLSGSLTGAGVSAGGVFCCLAVAALGVSVPAAEDDGRCCSCP